MVTKPVTIRGANLSGWGRGDFCPLYESKIFLEGSIPYYMYMRCNIKNTTNFLWGISPDHFHPPPKQKVVAIPRQNKKLYFQNRCAQKLFFHLIVCKFYFFFFIHFKCYLHGRGSYRWRPRLFLPTGVSTILYLLYTLFLVDTVCSKSLAEEYFKLLILSKLLPRKIVFSILS